MAKLRKRRKLQEAFADPGAGYFQNEMTVIARKVRKLIKYIGTILFGVFAYVQLKDLQVGTVIEYISPDFLRRLTVISYYWCWIFGATFDTDIQEVAYYSEKGRFKLGGQAVALIVLFGVVAAVLVWVASDDRLFASALTLFFLFNICGFAYILWFVRPIIQASHEKYRQEDKYFSLAQIELVSAYMNGKWQWARFALGMALIAVVTAICFSTTFRILTADLIARLTSIDSTLLMERLPTFMFVIFVALMEGWIWVQRARVIVALGLLEQLSEKYTLSPVIPKPKK